MSLTVNDFQRIANKAIFTSRDIELNNDATSAKLGRYFISAGKNKNKAVMEAFKNALKNEYGALGTHAFDTIVGSRNQLQKSLRACDVKDVMSNLVALKRNRFVSELNRQLDSHPTMLRLSIKMQEKVRDFLHKNPIGGTKAQITETLSNIKTAADMSFAVSDRLDHAIDEAIEFVESDNLFAKKESDKIDTSFHDVEENKETESEAGAREATGLKNLKTIFAAGRTSVEDQVKRGIIGEGMRINRSDSNPVLMQKLKTNGVEPGFIYTNDWSKNDTKGMLSDYESEKNIALLEELKLNNPKLMDDCKDKTLREQIMLAGRAHPAVMSAVAEYMLEEGMKDENSAIYKAFEKHFPDQDPEQWDHVSIDRLKSKLFAEIRDAVMNVQPKLPNGDDNPTFKLSPVFKHFSDRHIMKLDYNESERVRTYDAAHKGSFMRPERILTTRKPVLGQIYRLQTASSADSISSGAVTEALANDLTRIAGVPSQELQIVRGQYSDGHPKLMLQAKFAQGYNDMENGYLKDGRIVPPDNKPLESLGKYKAFFLVTADRDAVGRRGQNKGFAEGKFFAIDPGHSLEGNGKYLDIQDDFSFKDTFGKSTKPRFENFSVFDDDTRFSKLEGMIELRKLHQDGEFQKVFDDYRKAFDPNEKGIKPEEKALREKIHNDIDKKEREFNHQMSRLLKVFNNQLALYDDLIEDGPKMQEGAIETIANLEKLCSKTTWVSKKGLVPLKHLEVIPETRVPWYASVDDDNKNIVYRCDKPIPPMARELLDQLASRMGAKLSTDAQGSTTLVIPKDKAEGAFEVFTEKAVANLTHPEEAAERSTGGTGLVKASSYKPFPPAETDKRPPLTVGQLPERLQLTAFGKTIDFPKVHYQSLVENEAEATRPRSVEELKAFLEARIERGKEIIHSLLNGYTHRFPATMENITAFTIAIHAAARKKDEFMYRGSFSISDPDGNIARWLDTAKGIYQRTSTHAKPYQELMVDGHLNMPRGYDVAAPGKFGLLNGMRTFHYFSLPDMKHLEDAQGCGHGRRLFLKCETYGVFVNTIHLKSDKKNASKTEQMDTRGYEFGDVTESFLHGTSLFKSKFTSKNAPGIRKENLKDNTKSLIEAAHKELKKAGFNEIADKLVSNGVLDGGGINLLTQNISEMGDMLPEDPTKNAIAIVILDDLVGQLEDQITDGKYKMSREDELRLGNEIMINANDLV